jgi:hypothetical protein
VSPVKIVVAATAPDIQAESIAGAIERRPDMTLVGGRVLAAEELAALNDSCSLTGRCGIVLVGPDAATERVAEGFVRESPNYVVVRVAAPIGDIARIATKNSGLHELLESLRVFVEQAGQAPQTRIGRFPQATDSGTGTAQLASGARECRP